MPRGDGSGPQGQGPMSGRGLGICAGFDRPGFTQNEPGGGRFFGSRGMGGGRRRGGRGFQGQGLRRGWMPGEESAIFQGQENVDKNQLTGQLGVLKEQVRRLEERIAKLSVDE